MHGNCSIGPVVAGLESRPGELFVIEVVHIRCSKLFKGLESAVLSMVLCTLKTLEVIRLEEVIVPTSFCRDIATIGQENSTEDGERMR